MMAPDGRCKALDATADGYVRAEAVVVVAMHSTRMPQADGTPAPVAVMLKGSAVNQDGRSSSLTAPHGPSQQQVLLQALASGGLVPAALSAVEMHGTGTALGDPIEVGALESVLKRRSSTSVVELAAAKSTFGHTETAAGVVGLMHATGRLRAQARLSLLHLRALSTYVASTLEVAGQGRFAAARQAAPAQASAVVAAAGEHVGVSAFAFQGTNAHAVLQSRAIDNGDSNDGTAPLVMHTVAAWQRRRFWYSPPAHQLLFRNSVNQSSSNLEVLFEAALGRPVLAYLWEHQARWIAKPCFWIDSSPSHNCPPNSSSGSNRAAVGARPCSCACSCYAGGWTCSGAGTGG